ncbi:hypothetical protein C1I95_33310 [Micromonospora craterilacus]|uniref:Uncharacterized protein n=2 Tax=Micromonospora craterilacus TaxID=1655439 RepID=A0A2W2DX33_9ACTN|nr:hypothetical protein C1I95_33310 [Micromonospora craterilacus]
MGRGRSARADCPTCGRQVSVARQTERLSTHNDPETGEECTSSRQQIDLYGGDPAAPAAALTRTPKE